MAGSTVLGVLNKTLRRSALSNEFNPLITNTFNVYVASLLDIEDALRLRANAAGNSQKIQTAALTSLNKLLAALDNASTNTNFLVALKALSAAAKGEVLARKAVVKSEAVPLPPAQYGATISGALFGTFNFKPEPFGLFAPFYDAGFNTLTMNGISGTFSGSFANPIVTSRILFISIPNLVDGTTTYEIGDGSGKVFAVYSVARTKGTTSLGGDAYDAVSGSLTVTVNKANKTAVGTFNFTAPGEDTTARTSNGKFSVVWIP